MSFFRQNEIDFTRLKSESIQINESKISINKNYKNMNMNMNMNINENINLKELTESVKISMIEMIFRKWFKKEFKHDQIEKFYLIIIWKTNDNMRIDISIS